LNGFSDITRARDTNWQLRASSYALALAEVIFGASIAWNGLSAMQGTWGAEALAEGGAAAAAFASVLASAVDELLGQSAPHPGSQSGTSPPLCLRICGYRLTHAMLTLAA
jgi:hypothetical protein